jgi:hypothetical protein
MVKIIKNRLFVFEFPQRITNSLCAAVFVSYFIVVIWPGFTNVSFFLEIKIDSSGYVEYLSVIIDKNHLLQSMLKHMLMMKSLHIYIYKEFTQENTNGYTYSKMKIPVI